MDFSMEPLGDNALILKFGNEINQDTQKKVQSLASLLNEHPPDWLQEYVPAFTTVTFFYLPSHSSLRQQSKNDLLPYEKVCNYLKSLVMDLKIGDISETNMVEIPVCYGGEFGPDLPDVAHHNNLTEDQVIAYHTSGDYLVHMIGFAPGFPYLGGMPEQIAAPRRSSPRTKIPAGSVGIAGKQTGVYPIETPGGWQLIGKTPLALFCPKAKSPTLLKAGDKIRFKAITPEAFHKWKRRDE